MGYNASVMAAKTDTAVLVVIAENVRALRAAAGMSQEKLAEAAGLSRSAIATLETQRFYPDSRTLDKISDALGVTTDMLKTPMVRRIGIKQQVEQFFASEWAAALKPTADEKLWLQSLPEIVFFGSEPTAETVAKLLMWRRRS